MDAKEWLEGELSRFFGGLTEYPTSGLWINGQGSLEKEKVIVLETYTAKPSPATDIFKRLTFLMEVLGQESLAFAINNEFYFVTKSIEENGTETSEIRITDYSPPIYIFDEI